jgi:hypothetical protein
MNRGDGSGEYWKSWLLPRPRIGLDGLSRDGKTVSEEMQSSDDQHPPGELEQADSAAADVRFTLRASSDAGPMTAEQLLRHIVGELTAAAPQGWQRLDAVFVVTVADSRAYLVYTLADRVLRSETSAAVIELARRQREATVGEGRQPWWRLLVRASAAGETDTDYDYGAEPFPDGQLLSPESYRADLEAYPRDGLPVWLAAYVGHGDRQSRPPEHAAVAARADRAAGRAAARTVNEFPPYPVMWARWAVLSAAFVATGSDRGPRIMPSLGWFESARRSGATLYALPGERAVLSGGVWNAPELDAAYQAGGELPQLYAGAPEWVANPVLNPRALTGLMSFCYWWDKGGWHRGQSPAAAECDRAVPGVWTADTVIGIVAGLITDRPDRRLRERTANLVSAAEVGIVTRESIVEVFGDDTAGANIDGSWYQLMMAGVVASVPEHIAEQEAIEQVRGYIRAQGYDTSGYPLSDLIADRVQCGWMVYVPVPEGRIAIGRAIFYVADDGVLEHSSSSVAPSAYVEGFEQRYRQRHGSRN